MRRLIRQKNIGPENFCQSGSETGQKERAFATQKSRHEEYLPLIKTLLSECRYNLVRVHERLSLEHQVTLPYSTLTYLVRQYQLKSPKTQRVGEYHWEPGEEMQHDTSPHRVMIAGQSVKAQCASLVLAFSRQLFIQYYPCYTRFEAKIFLQQALTFMQGSCRRCVIDNTTVILASGSGQSAVVAKDMQFFSRFYGFEFMAHAVNDPNRKGRVERPFAYVENNFLAGRQFTDWEDLNRQARHWCEVVANQKSKRCLGMSPQAAYIQEKPFLLPLPEVALPIYQHNQRTVDTQGYINLETNRYSIPERHIGHEVEVYQYLDKVEIYYQHQLIAQHSRLVGVRDQKTSIKGHHRGLYRFANRQQGCAAEKALMGHHETLDDYVRALKSHVRGRGVWALKRLLYLKQLYPADAFMSAIQQAKHYGLYDMVRLEKLILRYVAGDFFNLTS